MAQEMIKLDWGLLCFLILVHQSLLEVQGATNLQSDGDLTNNLSLDEGGGVVSDAPLTLIGLVTCESGAGSSCRHLHDLGPVSCKSPGVQITSLICIYYAVDRLHVDSLYPDFLLRSCVGIACFV